MKDIQEIFNQIQEEGRELRELRAVYKDSLNSTGEYQEIVEDINNKRVRKKQIEAAVDAQMSEHMAKMESIAKSIVNGKQMLADIALSTLIKGEIVKVVGPDDTTYEPSFSVRFKKKQ